MKTEKTEKTGETSQAVVQALQEIADNNNGLLAPADVVNAARPKNSPLHSSFQWDDSLAAEQYRLWQARMLIRVTVRYLPGVESNEPVRVFVSLTGDRKPENGEAGGYRTLVSVMTDEDLREQLLADAMADMQRFKTKYSALKELAGIIAEMDRSQLRVLKATA